MKNRKRLAAIAMAGILAAGALAGCGSDSGSNMENKKAGASSENSSTDKRESEFGDLLSFTCETLDGGSFTEKNIAEKDLTIVNFWMTSCGPCIQEMPELEELRKMLPDNVQLVLVSLDNPRDIEGVKAISKGTGYSGISVMCGDGDMQKLSQRIMYTPTTLFFNKEGRELGASMIGGQRDFFGAYKGTVDKLLSDMGKTAEWKES